jgi:hypothetical protein
MRERQDRRTLNDRRSMGRPGKYASEPLGTGAIKVALTEWRPLEHRRQIDCEISQNTDRQCARDDAEAARLQLSCIPVPAIGVGSGRAHDVISISNGATGARTEQAGA